MGTLATDHARSRTMNCPARVPSSSAARLRRDHCGVGAP